MKYTGQCIITPNEYMKEQFQQSIDKAGSAGLHLVHVFYKDAISGELSCRKAYFDGYGDAEAYAYEYDQTHKKSAYLIFVNCELYVGRFYGTDAEEFMASTKKQVEGTVLEA